MYTVLPPPRHPFADNFNVSSGQLNKLDKPADPMFGKLTAAREIIIWIVKVT